MRWRTGLRLALLAWWVAACSDSVSPTVIKGVDVDGGADAATKIAPVCNGAFDLSRVAAPAFALVDVGEVALTNNGTVLFNAEQEKLPLVDATLQICVPEDTISFALALDKAAIKPASPQASSLVWSFVTPQAGELFPDTSTQDKFFASPAQPVFGSQSVAMLLHPKIPDRAPIGGTYTVRIGSDIANYKTGELAYGAGLKIAVRRGDPEARTSIGLNIVFIDSVYNGTNGMGGMSSAQKALFGDLPTRLNAIYGSANFRIDANRFGMATIADESLAIVDVSEASIARLTNAPLVQMTAQQVQGLTLQPKDVPTALHVFVVSQVVSDLSDNTPSFVDAFASSIPGALGFPPTVGSGVFLSWSSIRSAAGGLLPLSNLLPLVVAHETGHWLGLHHTTESSGARHDLLDDTPECPASNDIAPRDGVVAASECPSPFDGTYLMFWNAKGTQLSAKQAKILRWNPLAVVDVAGGL